MDGEVRFEIAEWVGRCRACGWRGEMVECGWEESWDGEDETSWRTCPDCDEIIRNVDIREKGKGE